VLKTGYHRGLPCSNAEFVCRVRSMGGHTPMSQQPKTLNM